MILTRRTLTGCALNDADFGCRREDCQEWPHCWGCCRSKGSGSRVWHLRHLCSCPLCRPGSWERGPPCSEGNLDMLPHVYHASSLSAVCVMQCGASLAPPSRPASYYADISRRHSRDRCASQSGTGTGTEVDISQTGWQAAEQSPLQHQRSSGPGRASFAQGGVI